MPAPLRGGDSGVRDVSIEELIDLEQQAEFFIVLGQDEAAVDLLVDHLRSTGGGSPLPYLKLLEIYSRTEDRGAYERNRARCLRTTLTTTFRFSPNPETTQTSPLTPTPYRRRVDSALENIDELCTNSRSPA